MRKNVPLMPIDLPRHKTIDRVGGCGHLGSGECYALLRRWRAERRRKGPANRSELVAVAADDGARDTS
jgi:hypothetical protein